MDSKSNKKVKRSGDWVSLKEATADAIHTASKSYVKRSVDEARIDRAESEAERKILAILEDDSIGQEESLERIRRILESVPARSKGGAA